jgi:predicted phage terminase large subunit-like protein
MTSNNIDTLEDNIDLNLRAKLLGSFLLFVKTFYLILNGREFLTDKPKNREDHIVTICKALTRVFRDNVTKLIINVPPRYGKTELLSYFIAWTLAHYPDSNYICVSYSFSLAEDHAKLVRDIISSIAYKQMFEVAISGDTRAKSDFTTTAGGSIYAAGTNGTITGHGAGIMGQDRWGGCIVIDDIHKPEDVVSDVIRKGDNEWYSRTLLSRRNQPNKTPIIFIVQRLHEDDLFANLEKDEREEWEIVKLPSLDEHDYALCERLHTKEDLIKMREKSPYVFYSQYQQNPQPAGGSLFKKDWFKLLDVEPEINTIFITADTAETDKTYNDKTVFSCWGVYKVIQNNVHTDITALHWIACDELSIEPCDLESAFWDFYRRVMTHKVKASFAAIEKKSTGVTLTSVLKKVQGIRIVPIERSASSGSKANRFLSAQPYISQGLISLPTNGKHTNKCLEHMAKITANNTHAFDDIADTAADAIEIALINNIALTIYGFQNVSVIDDYSRTKSVWA